MIKSDSEKNSLYNKIKDGLIEFSNNEIELIGLKTPDAAYFGLTDQSIRSEPITLNQLSFS